MISRGSSLLATAILASCLLAIPHSAQAHDTIAIVSPGHEQTWPWAELKNYSWTLSHGTRLALVLTYSNQDLASHDDPPRDEDFWFEFPSLRFDPASGNFLYTAKGRSVVVAHRSNGFFKTTALAPDTLAVVLRRNGALRAAIALHPGPHPAHQSLVEINRPGPLTLQSLIGTTVEYH